MSEAKKSVSIPVGKKISIWIDEKKITGKIDHVGPTSIQFRADGGGELVSIKW